jgi:hypothetical protein
MPRVPLHSLLKGGADTGAFILGANVHTARPRPRAVARLFGVPLPGIAYCRRGQRHAWDHRPRRQGGAGPREGVAGARWLSSGMRPSRPHILALLNKSNIGREQCFLALDHRDQIRPYGTYRYMQPGTVCCWRMSVTGPGHSQLEFAVSRNQSNRPGQTEHSDAGTMSPSCLSSVSTVRL